MQPLYKFKNQLYLAKWDCRAYLGKRYTKWIPRLLSARIREQHWKHRHRETHRLINEAGVEIDVGIEFALHEVIVFQGNAFTLQSDFEERVLAHKLEHFIRDVLDDAGSGIVILVDAMAESHEFHFAGFDALDEVGNFLDRAN